MACRSMLRSVILVERILFRPFDFNFNQYHIASCYKCNKLRTIGARQFHPPKPPLFWFYNEMPPHHDDQRPPQEAVLKAISEVSKIEGRAGQTTNMVNGGTIANDSTNEWAEWLALDQMVNSYPTVRRFTAIGTGGGDFVQAMVVAVEYVIQQPIPQGYVRQKVSSGGKYVSVNIGPIQVVSSEQVLAVYTAMRRDNRMKYFL